LAGGARRARQGIYDTQSTRLHAKSWLFRRETRAIPINIKPCVREVSTRRQKTHLATWSDAERIADLYVFGNEVGGRIDDFKLARTRGRKDDGTLHRRGQKEAASRACRDARVDARQMRRLG
jgi:hypothetical protein